MIKFVLTCEHGGNSIPNEYKYIFKNSLNLLSAHQGYDIGALELFKELKPLSDFSSYSRISRLLIELNRSLHHKNLFSSITKQFDNEVKDKIINKYYFPYRSEVENEIAYYISKGHTVLHISVHTFTPVLNNIERNCDIGLLYDPKHGLEKYFCRLLKGNILLNNSLYNVRFNYPYLGTADGFTSYLRKQFPKKNYLGIEIEVNNKLLIGKAKRGKLNITLKNALLETLNHKLL